MFRGRIILFVIIYFIISCHEKENEPIYDEGKVIVGTESLTARKSLDLSDWEPDLSTNGLRLVYTARNSVGQTWLTLLDIESGVKFFLAEGGFNPSWNPDGSWIAFNVNSAIYKIKSNGDSLTLLAGEGSSFAPEWSSDGNRIIYDRSLSDQFGPLGLWLMDKNGGNKQFLTRARFAKWKSDKELLAVKFYDETLWSKFPIINISNMKEIMVLDAVRGEDNRHPELSLDGKRIVFWNSQGIWVLNIDGTGLRKVLPWKQIFKEPKGDQLGFIVGTSPTWHPDGKHILYQHLRITDYDEPTGLSFGPWYEGVMSLRLLNVE